MFLGEGVLLDGVDDLLFVVSCCWLVLMVSVIVGGLGGAGSGDVVADQLAVGGGLCCNVGRVLC